MKIKSICTRALAVLAGSLLAACSTTSVFKDYSAANLYSTEIVGNVPYVEVGPAAASARGFFWERCTALTDEAIAQMQREAQSHGATHVSNVRWLNHSDGSYSDKPTCTTGWGWFAAGVVGGFMPWVKATEFQGRLAYAEDARLVPLRAEVAKRSGAWAQAEQQRLEAEKMSQEQGKMSQEQKEADEAEGKAAAEKAAADQAAAEQAAAAVAASAAAEAARRAAADKAAAEQAAAERAAADKTAAEAAAAQREADAKAMRDRRGKKSGS